MPAFLFGVAHESEKLAKLVFHDLHEKVTRNKRGCDDEKAFDYSLQKAAFYLGIMEYTADGV